MQRICFKMQEKYQTLYQAPIKLVKSDTLERNNISLL